MTIVVAGASFSGEVEDNNVGPTRLLVTGTLDADGHGVAFTIDHRFGGTISFRGDRFEALWANGVCERHAAGDRAPEPAAIAAAAEERKQRQAAYADEIRRAEAGQAVEDTKL